MRISYMFFLFFLSSCVHAETPLWELKPLSLQTKEQYHDCCMNLWTRIDLAQAIATTKMQRKTMLRAVVKNLEALLLYSELLSSEEDYYFYKKLIQEMRFSFLNAFPASNNRWYKKARQLFETLLSQLKGPIYLKTDSTS